jgi:phage shock protein PspC (stress-responsive transcriptional regulator)
MSAVPPGPSLDIVRHAQRRARRPEGHGTITRPRTGRRIAGVAVGIAQFVDAPHRIVRALWLLSVPLSFGITVLGYVLLWWLIPPEPRRRDEATG